MDSILAKGSNYFDIQGLALTLGKSQSHPGPNSPPPHPHDLTEVNHHHDFCELVIVTKGVGIQCLEGMDLPISGGDIFLLQGKQSHYFHHRDNLELINIMYDPELIKLPENDLLRMPGYGAMFILEPRHRKAHKFASRLHLRREQLLEVENLIGRMFREKAEKKDGFEVILRAKLLELITYVSRAYVGEPTRESQSLLRVTKVISAMEQNFADDWKLDDFVEISKMSKSSLLSTFRKATGKSPLAYLLSLRIQRAGELLRTSEKNITEIAYEVGFNDSNYFTRQFRKATQYSPREFRSKHQ